MGAQNGDVGFPRASTMVVLGAARAFEWAPTLAPSIKPGPWGLGMGAMPGRPSRPPLARAIWDFEWAFRPGALLGRPTSAPSEGAQLEGHLGWAPS